MCAAVLPGLPASFLEPASVLVRPAWAAWWCCSGKLLWGQLAVVQPALAAWCLMFPGTPWPPRCQVVLIDLGTGRERVKSMWQQGVHQVRLGAGPGGGRRLRFCFAGHWVGCLPPWLMLAGRAGCVPDASLPAALLHPALPSPPCPCPPPCCQAVEAKESLPVSPENYTTGTVSYQSLFGYYHRLAGMTVSGRVGHAPRRSLHCFARAVGYAVVRQLDSTAACPAASQPWCRRSACLLPANRLAAPLGCRRAPPTRSGASFRRPTACTWCACRPTAPRCGWTTRCSSSSIRR